VKVDYCSDLHVDSWTGSTAIHDPSRRMWEGEPRKSRFLHIDWRAMKNPDSTILIIAGDISNDVITSADVVAAAASEYEHVVVTMGNHETYMTDATVDLVHEGLRDLLRPYTNVHLLNWDCGVNLDGLAILGCLGWYDFSCYEDLMISQLQAKLAWSRYSNDSRYPQFGDRDVEIIAAEEAINLASQVSQAAEDDAIWEILVVTHTSPRADIMEWRDNDDVWNYLTPSYVNTAMDQVLPISGGKIRHWIYGHTHHRQTLTKDGVDYRNNARGYPNENAPFRLEQLELSRPT